MDRGGFAGAIRTEQSHNLTALHGERHFIQRDDVPILLMELVDAQGGFSDRHLGRRRGHTQLCNDGKKYSCIDTLMMHLVMHIAGAQVVTTAFLAEAVT